MFHLIPRSDASYELLLNSTTTPPLFSVPQSSTHMQNTQSRSTDDPLHHTDISNNTNTNADSSSENMFKLSAQPYERQRKSYKSENRYVLPNPLLIVPSNAAHIPSDLSGTATVALADEKGEAFPDQQQEQLLQGTKIQPLALHSKMAEFTLKIMTISEGKFRLKFTVDYKTAGKVFQEVILSLPFRVISNMRTSAVECPVIFDMKPRHARFDDENAEVWIRGKNFTDR